MASAVNAGQDETDGKKKPEPSSPQPAPKGPIPMPCSPDLYKQEAETEKQRLEAEEDNRSRRSVSPKVEAKESKPVVPEQTAPQEQTPPPPPPAPPAANLSPPESKALAKMQTVKDEVLELAKRIRDFKGSKKDKEYLYLDEMLTRHLLSLDGVDTCGKDELRSMRKESIRTINRCLSLLDAQAKTGGVDAEANNAVLDQLAKKK